MDISMSRFASRATPCFSCMIYMAAMYIDLHFMYHTCLYVQIPLFYLDLSLWDMFTPWMLRSIFCTRICAPFQLLDTQIVKQSVNIHFSIAPTSASHLYMDLLVIDYLLQMGQVDSKAAVRSRLLCWLRGWVRSVQCKRLSIMSWFWFVLADFMFCSYVIASFWDSCFRPEGSVLTLWQSGGLGLGREGVYTIRNWFPTDSWRRGCSWEAFSLEQGAIGVAVQIHWVFMEALNPCQDSQKMDSCLQKTAS